MVKPKLSRYLLFLLMLAGHVLQASPSLFFERVHTAGTGPQTPVYGIGKDQQGFLWFGSWDGLYRYDGISFRSYRSGAGHQEPFTSNRIRTIFKDSAQDLYVWAFDQAYYRFSPESEHFELVPALVADSLSLDSLSQLSLIRGRNVRYKQQLWTIEGDRLWETDLSSGKKLLLKADYNTPGSLTNDFVSWIYLDDQLILWIGLQNGDINKADLRRKPFNFQYNRIRDEGIWKNAAVRVVYGDGERLWLASNSRGVSFADHTGHKSELEDVVPAASHLTKVRAIVADRKGNVWFANPNGIHCLLKNSGKIKSYQPREFGPSILNNTVFSMLCADDGTICAGVYNAIAFYKPEEDRFDVRDLSPLIHDHSIMDMHLSGNGDLWLATEGDGLICLRESQGAKGWKDTLSFRRQNDNEHSLCGNRVYTLYEDDQSVIWVGTSDGLCYIDKSGIVERADTSTGLNRQYITYITGDHAGNIWIAHKNGLARYNKRSKEVRHFSSLFNNQPVSFLDRSGWNDPKTGIIYLGTQDGYISFNPDQILVNPDAPVVVFTSLQVQNQPVAVLDTVNGEVLLPKSLPFVSSLSFSYWERSFSIAFAALHYSEPQNNRYLYKLEGYDSDWIRTDALHAEARYSNLPPGNYELHVRAANPDGVWSLEDAILRIEVQPPFWETVPAYVLYFLLVAGMLIWVYFYLISKEKFRSQLALERLEKQKALELDNLKLEFYTNVSHELRTPLSLIIDPVEKLQDDELTREKRKEYIRIIHRNASRLLQLINQLLDFRKIETSNETVNLTNADWVAFAQSIADSFQLRAQQRGIKLDFYCKLFSLFCLLDEDKFEKILVNLISNAIKYTPDSGSITVTMKVENENLLLLVQDNGIGIASKALPHLFDPFVQVKGNRSFEGSSTGIGLALTKSLVELLGGQIQVESVPKKGSTFTVRIPIKVSRGVPAEPDGVELDLTEEAKPLLLLVDDNEEILHYLEREMQADYKILTARDGKEAKQKATTWIPDIVVSDVVMPETDGLEFCRILKTDIRTSHIPVILLTARQSQGFRIEGLEQGADAYLTKPFNTSVLKAQIKSLIENRRKVQSRYVDDERESEALPSAGDLEAEFLQQAIALVQANLTTDGFNSELLAEHLNLGQRQLYRKLHALTGQTVHQFITSIRMDEAKRRLRMKNKTISEVAFEVGYTELSNFSRSFSKQFGKSPSQFLAEN